MIEDGVYSVKSLTIYDKSDQWAARERASNCDESNTSIVVENGRATVKAPVAPGKLPGKFFTITDEIEKAIRSGGPIYLGDTDYGLTLHGVRAL